MKTENELIAEFMPKSGVFYLDPTNGITLCEIEDLKYHSSWDWLMPAVSKVNTLFDEDSLHGLDVDVYRSMQDWVASVNIQNAYADLVTIIKWYNENKQP
jgi:hypothetical protein